MGFVVSSTLTARRRLIRVVRPTQHVLIMDVPAADQSDERGLFLSWRHPVSQRVAILEEGDGMVWLYLSHPEVTRPARDCPAFVTAPPPATVDWERVRQGETPRIAADIATDRSLIQSPEAEDFGTTWTPDGESVALRYRGEIICMIVAGHQRGHSRAVSRVGPLGVPFDEPLALATFTPGAL